MIDFPIFNCKGIRASATLEIDTIPRTCVIDGDVILRRIPSERLGPVQAKYREAFGDSHPSHAQFEVIKEFKCEVHSSQAFSKSIAPVKSQLQDILASMRLLKLGCVDFEGLHFEPLDPEVHAMIQNGPRYAGTMLNLNGPIVRLPRYALGKGDLPKIEKLISEVRRTDLARQFFFKRFTRSFHQSAEDRIVDSVIAMESLLCPEKGSEVGYRFRMRGAYILGEDSSSRLGFTKVLKGLYSLRSKIVHGGLMEKHKSVRDDLAILGAKSVCDAGPIAMEYTRQLLRKWVEDHNSFQAEKLDAMLLQS